MARTDAGTYTPESLSAVAAALQAVAERLTRTAEAMREKEIATLEVKNQAGLKSGIAGLRSFGMAAEEALEEWVFDQRVFSGGTASDEESPKTRPESGGRKSRKHQEPKQPDAASDS